MARHQVDVSKPGQSPPEFLPGNWYCPRFCDRGWRTGNSPATQHRTLYRAGKLIGVCFEGADATMIAEVMNWAEHEAIDELLTKRMDYETVDDYLNRTRPKPNGIDCPKCGSTLDVGPVDVNLPGGRVKSFKRGEKYCRYCETAP